MQITCCLSNFISKVRESLVLRQNCQSQLSVEVDYWFANQLLQWIVFTVFSLLFPSSFPPLVDMVRNVIFTLYGLCTVFKHISSYWNLFSYALQRGLLVSFFPPKYYPLLLLTIFIHFGSHTMNSPVTTKGVRGENTYHGLEKNIYRASRRDCAGRGLMWWRCCPRQASVSGSIIDFDNTDFHSHDQTLKHTLNQPFFHRIIPNTSPFLRELPRPSFPTRSYLFSKQDEEQYLLEMRDLISALTAKSFQRSDNNVMVEIKNLIVVRESL